MEASIAAKINAKEFLTNQAREVLTSRANSKQFPSLQHLAAMCIWKQQAKFHHPKPQVNIFELIPNSLRSYLVDEFSAVINKKQDFMDNEGVIYPVYLMLARLFNEKVVNFTWPTMLGAPSSFVMSQLWKSVLDKCPNLQSLDYSFNGVRDHCRQAPYLDPLVQRMHPQLQIVKLNDLLCNDDDLSAMARNMPNLRVLNVSRLGERVTADGFKALSKLDHFEEFYFCQVNSSSTKRHFALCLQHLPKLRFAGEIKHQYYPDVNYGRITTKWLDRVNKPTTIGLQKMSLCQVSSIPDGICLPNLTSLNLQRPRVDFKCDDQRLSGVSELSLYEVTMDVCVHILGHLGRQLNYLRLFVSDEIQVDQIFNMCPNLDWLSIIEPQRFATMSSAQINPDNLRQLTVLELSEFSIGEEFEDEFVRFVANAGGLLLQLLQAPELRKIKLSLFVLEQAEVKEIVHRLQQREILQNLELAVMEPFHKHLEDLEDLCQVETEQVNLLLNEMILNCPNLLGVFDYFVCC